MTIEIQSTPVLEEYSLPTAEAMLAGTLALMTCCGSHAGAAPCPAMAAKVAANLFHLGRNRSLSPPFRMLMDKLRLRWEGLCDAKTLQRLHAEVDCHPAARVLQ